MRSAGMRARRASSAAVSRLSWVRSVLQQAGGVQLVEVREQHQAVEYRDAEQGDETHRGRHRQVLAGRPQGDRPADQRERDIGEDQQRLAHRADRKSVV